MASAVRVEGIEQNFRELVIRQSKFCGLNKYLTKDPDFVFPKIDESLLGWKNGRHITIPGMFGGFDYYLEEMNGRLLLYAEQSSRMDHSSDDYMYFEITENGSRILEGEEREMIQKRFKRLDEKRFEEYKRKMEERRKHKPSKQK